jgi:hypothetical protein
MPAFHQRILASCSRASPDKIIAIAIPVLCTLVLGEAYFRTSLSDADSSTTCRYPPVASVVGREHVRELERAGYVVIHNAVPPHVLAQARKDVSIVISARHDELVGGEVGGDDVVKAENADDEDSEKERGDSVCWLRESDGCASKSSLAPPKVSFRSDDSSNNSNSSNSAATVPLGDGIYHCIKFLRGVPHALESNHYATSDSHRIPQQCQLARYPTNDQSGYPRHLDQCDSNLTELGLLEYWRLSDYRGRSITSILYLNDAGWDGDRDGGQIRCYGDDEKAGDTAKGKPGEMFEDVVPVGGTLLIFDSRRIEHEVLPSRRERLALTSWASGVVKVN